MSGKKLGRTLGHLFAVLTIIVRGITFVATDRLLEYYTGSQILLMRFVLAYAVLWIINPHRMKLGTVREELDYILMSATGIIGYFTFENEAIKNGGATNTSIFISFVPIVTLVMLCVTGKKKKLSFRHFIGFLIAIAGVCLVVYNGAAVRFDMNFKSVLCAFGACVCWGIYSIAVGRRSGKNPIQVTRRMLFWALLFIIPLCYFTDGFPELHSMLRLSNIACIVILGIFGSGICYCMWSSSIRRLGVDITTNYVYVQPFVTLIAAIIIGIDAFSLMSAAGAVLILTGVVISDNA